MQSKFNWDIPFSCGRIGMSFFGTILKHCSIEVQKYTDSTSFLHSLLLGKTHVQNWVCVLNKFVMRQVFLRILWFLPVNYTTHAS
jgi:hypothetical protein